MDKFIKTAVAVRNGSKFKWDLNLERINAYKKAYHVFTKNIYKNVTDHGNSKSNSL